MTKKQKDELDAGKAGNNQRLWSSILDEYNDLENDKVYGVFAFVEVEQIDEFAKEFDVTMYIKLDWMKVAAWFKAIISEDYKLALTWFTKSGKHQPDFYKFCQKKAKTYYYPLCAESKPNLHKAFSVVFTDDVFSESAVAGKGSGKQGVPCGSSPRGLKRKEEAMTRVANLMKKTFVASK
jgi:hypothetical protein